jgi:predicted ester cyclase
MKIDPQQAIVLQCMGGFKDNDLSRLQGCFQDDYVRHVTPGLKGVNSFAEHVADLQQRRAVLEDAHFEVEEIISEGDVVAARFSLVGRHVGTFLGIPATGRLMNWTRICFFHFRDGKIAENYFIADMHGMLRALKSTKNVGHQQRNTPLKPDGAGGRSTEVPTDDLKLDVDASTMKRIVRQVVESTFNERSWSSLKKFLSEDFVGHGYSADGRDVDAQGYTSHLQQSSAAFDDPQIRLEEMCVQGSTVAARYTRRGVHTNTQRDPRSGGRPITQQAAAFFHFRHGKIAESFAIVDVYGTEVQLAR